MTGLAPRGLGGIEFLRDHLPDVALEALGLVTWLGSVVVLVPLTTVIYWFEARETGAFALAAVLGGAAITVVFKAGFGLPRPPDELWLMAASGFGFPSGHAIASTVGWGSLAALLDRRHLRRRLAIAGVIVALVALSRVALGVHYVVDVLAGIAVGTAYLSLLLWLGSPSRAFATGTVVATLAVLTTGGGGDALLLFGATAGGWLAWVRLPVSEIPWQSGGILPAIVSTPVFGLLALAGYYWELAAPLEVGIGAVALAGVIGLPPLVDRLSKRGPTE